MTTIDLTRQGTSEDSKGDENGTKQNDLVVLNESVDQKETKTAAKVHPIVFSGLPNKPITGALRYSKVVGKAGPHGPP